ncbi:MAG: PfkB family carbohydrate kinase [Pseudomonadota bacterium]
MASASENKERSLEDVAAEVEKLRKAGKTIVHCHGVFDLLHIGHIKHLRAAKKHGDVLVVTITQDRYVNKGPHRPAFGERHRSEALASIECVDLVAINAWPTAVETIRLLKPDVFVKGSVKEKGPRDHSNAITEEEEAVKSVGGRLAMTYEETFSASSLINQYVDVYTPEVKAFLEDFRKHHKPEGITGQLDKIRGLKVLAIGETIVDEYEFCRVMDKANKDPILAAEHLYEERYGGGVLAIANHIASFCDEVGVLSFLGDRNSHAEFVRAKLKPSVKPHFFTKSESPTIVKRRFLEEYLAVKIFELYEINGEPLAGADEARFCGLLEELLPKYDVVVVADYGHGLFTPKSISLLCKEAKFLAVNAQVNAGNRGFNFVSKYPRADYISIDEPEARLETRNQKIGIKDLIKMITDRVSCPRMMLTVGKKGSVCFEAGSGFVTIPSFGVRLVDRIGAGDAVLGVTAPCVAAGIPMEEVGFIGNVVGAEACGIMGNKSSIDRASIFRHITSLMK